VGASAPLLKKGGLNRGVQQWTSSVTDEQTVKGDLIMAEEKIIDPVDDLFSDLDIEVKKLEGDDPDKKVVDDPKVEPTVTTDDKVTDLMEQVELLKKERQGFLNATKAERVKRQEMKANYDTLSGTVSGILQQRQAAKNDDSDDMGVPVEFSEDGEQAFVKQDKINELLVPLHREITDLKQALATTTGVQESQRKAQETVDSIVGSDDRYDAVYNKYKAARKWVNDQVIDYQKDNSLSGVMTSGQALDQVLIGDLEANFKEKFKEFDLIDVATAEDSQRHFTKMLDKTANIFETLDEKAGEKKVKDTSKFKQIINKPSGLGSATNAKAGELSITEKAGKLDSSDIMNLSDDQAKALEAALLNEEVSEGVKF